MFETDGQLEPHKMCDYRFVSSQFTPQHGRFFSPHYPANYPPNIRCSYQFRARSKERIRVVFEELSLEKGDVSCLNRADLIKVYDGSDTSKPAIAMLCNEDSEAEVLSTGSEMLVDFVANSQWHGQGFKAKYQFQPIEDHHVPEADRMAASNNQASLAAGRNSLIGPAVSATSKYTIQLSMKSNLNTSIISPREITWLHHQACIAHLVNKWLPNWFDPLGM
ncbi:hypothetical protein QAD02_018468, partial [Eretmocerus hayati]